MSKTGRNAALKSGLGAKVEAPPGRPEFGVSSALPALSVCRLEAPEDLLRKLRQHVDDPALADFTCPICWDPFWQPVRTICGHAFCEGCLLKAVLAQLNHQQPDVSCPLCRHPLHVDDVAVDQALLTRIRLVLTEKDKENVNGSRRSNGRVYRGLVAATHGNSGPSTANCHPSSSTSAPVSNTQRPRTREGAVSSTLGPADLEGLAVLAAPSLSGSTHGQSSRVQTPHRGVPLRGPPRTAPTISRGSEEGPDGLFPNGWFRVSASSPCGGRTCSRPGTSPATSMSARESNVLSQRPPSTAPEEELGSLTMGTPRRSEVQKPSTSRPGFRQRSSVGGGIQGDSVSRPSTTPGRASPPVRRCGWGPIVPPVAGNQASIEMPTTSSGPPQMEQRSGGLRTGRPVRHRRKISRASGSNSTNAPIPPDVSTQATPNNSGTTVLETAQVTLASIATGMAEKPDPNETETDLVDQSNTNIGPQSMAYFNATAWAEAIPLPSVVRPPPTDFGATTQGVPLRLEETGPGNSPSQTTQHTQNRPPRASLAPNGHANNAPTGRHSVPPARRSCVGSTQVGSAENAGLMSRFLNSAAGALSAAVGWSSHTQPERGNQRSGQQNGFGMTPALDTTCNHNTNYAADFAFADRYRQLLEEGA